MARSEIRAAEAQTSTEIVVLAHRLRLTLEQKILGRLRGFGS